MSLADVLTEKQQAVLQSYLHDDWRVLILSGAVRAGKTWISDWLFLLELKRVRELAKKNGDPHPIVILAGYSSNSIYTNVIASIEKSFGLTMKTDRHGHYRLFDIDIVPAYTGNKKGVGAIRGATAYSAYIDEGSLADQSVFQEILQRCSVEGSRIIVTTNPDTPVNFLKAKYIDNKNPKARIKSFSFTIDDNTFLAPEYVESLKAATPSGMYYDRSILGMWVSGEGAVYRDFDKRTMVIDRAKLPEMDRYVAGVDWGYQHKGCIVVFGIKGDKWYLVEERTKQYREIDYWTDVAHQLQRKYGAKIPFVCDTARTEHIDHFRHAGINAKYGWKAVVSGIELVARTMKERKFYVCEQANDQFLDEVYNYRWNDKVSDDAVIKEDDDVMDAVRYAIATTLHLEEQKQNYPKTSHQTIRAGMRRLGL